MGSDITEIIIFKMITITMSFVPVRTSGTGTTMVREDRYTGWTMNRPYGRIRG